VLNGSGSTLAGSALLLAPFIERFDVLAHDQRGLGRTAIPAGPYTMADYAEDALALLDHVGWDACRVFGISFGGMVAQELAVRAPERVERLALVCTSAGGDAGASFPLHERAALPITVDTRFTDEWLADPEHGLDRALVKARDTKPSDDPEVRRGVREQLLARSHHDVAERLGRITCPTLVAAGRYDGIAPPANSEAIAQRIAGADLRIYEGGHAFLAQDRQAFKDVLAFLGS
jgi:pimeloyl-ACP methyl ester carboxylesterase